MHKKQHLLLFFLFFIFLGWSGNAQKKCRYPKNEFRGVWIATVVNIDWPKSRVDSTKKQKADYLEILDAYKKLNFNAVIVQIRSAGDAIYPTKLAPWSRYLTGKEGQEPKPYFDILAWMIEQAHKRGFEFHAWMNPYRATFDLKKDSLSVNHDAIKHPEWMIEYGGKMYYDPALPKVQEHLTTIVEEVVENYDIDAIHFDDYFYPYTVPGKEFNDTASYKKYGNGLSLADWRRANVSNFIQTISTTIKSCKPWVQFGISPFGVWRNKSKDSKGSDTQSTSNYDDLYADPILWMNQKWIDYILPQLYWSMNNPKASYAKLVKWWSENSNNTAVYIGHSPYKIRADSDKSWNSATEIPNQVDFARNFKNVTGSAYFSAKLLINKNQDVVRLLSENEYKYLALPFAVPNLKKVVADVPVIKEFTKDSVNYSFNIEYPLNTKVRYVVIYGAGSKTKIDVDNPTQIIDKLAVDEIDGSVCFVLPKKVMKQYKACAITFVDYCANESSPTIINLKKEFEEKNIAKTTDENRK